MTAYSDAKREFLSLTPGDLRKQHKHIRAANPQLYDYIQTCLAYADVVKQRIAEEQERQDVMRDQDAHDTVLREQYD